MADHIRKRVRAAVGTLLTGLATTGSRVYTSQYYSLSAAEMPALIIYTPEEDSSSPPPKCHPGTLRRIITLTVEAVVTGTGNLADALDQIAKEVEARMATDFTLGATCKEVQLVRTAFTFRATDSPQPGASLQMNFTVVAPTLEGVPDVVT